MELIYVKKQPDAANEEGFTYVVPAMPLQTKDGTRHVPHPFGKASVAYNSLEETLTAIHRAGFSADINGTVYEKRMANASNAMIKSKSSKPNASLTEFDRLKKITPRLIRQMEDTSPVVVASACFALGEFRLADSVPALIKAFSHEDANVRKNAGEAIAKIGVPALEAVKVALEDSHWLVRHSALVPVNEWIRTRLEWVPQFLNILDVRLTDDNWLVRSQTALVLAELAKAYYGLEEQLTNKNA